MRKLLSVAIAKNVDTEAVLIQGFANLDVLATTISSQNATFYSQSHSTLWMKDYLPGKPDGPTCHRGSDTCYYTSVSDMLKEQEESEDKSGASSEIADVLYHAMVLLALKGVKTEDVLKVLQRFSRLGIEGKHSGSPESSE